MSGQRLALMLVVPGLAARDDARGQPHDDSWHCGRGWPIAPRQRPRTSTGWMPFAALRLWWRDEKVVRIRDYFHVDNLLHDARTAGEDP